MTDLIQNWLSHSSDIIRALFLYNPDAPLFFTRLYFWGFFILVFGFYSAIYKFTSARNFYLFIVSIFFYYKTSGLFFLLLLFTTLACYFFGFKIHKSQSQWKRKTYLFLAVFINLTILAYFKYTYLLVDGINAILGTQIKVVDVLGELGNFMFDASFNISHIVLPAGISFYTFQAISYVVDVYKNKLDPVKKFSDFGFYVSFFPQLVAGPIVRASEFIPQMYKPYALSKAEFGYAIFLILNGLIKKIVVADYLATNFIDRVFENPALYTSLENILATFAYSLQVYCDFSGYTDIAIGTALVFGFKIPTNFNSPYKALNVGDFWKRWHISLSNWLKDYLYIPLGGNKKGVFRTEINLMLTMLLGGLWHGADIKFIIWGGLNGLGIITYKYWRKISPYENSKWLIAHFWKIFFTFSFISFTRIFFRAESIESATEMLIQMGKYTRIELIPEIIMSYALILSIMIFGFIIHWLPSRTKEIYRGWFIQMPLWLKFIVVIITVFCIYQAYSSKMQAFIYFQF